MNFRRPELQAPFVWFGGKSRVADLVWSRLGAVPNYVEPFFGSGAVLLARPDEPGIETVNDKDGYVANAWRAIAAAPDEVSHYADWPSSECDLHARRLWLKARQDVLVEQLMGNPEYFDARIAGWWLWGMAQWIGGGFCGESGSGPWASVDGRMVRADGAGVSRKLLHLGNTGRGVARQLLHLGNTGQGTARPAADLYDWMRSLSDRLRRVRVCCGDWSRICGPTPTTKLGLTGVFLDPPYSAEAGRDGALYATEDLTVAHDVREWAITNGDNQLLRIALCGYKGEHAMPESWECVAWKAHGGYAMQSNGPGQENKHRERIWFSPHCIKPPTLFTEAYD